jgi:hypothetical protein
MTHAGNGEDAFTPAETLGTEDTLAKATLSSPEPTLTADNTHNTATKPPKNHFHMYYTMFNKVKYR